MFFTMFLLVHAVESKLEIVTPLAKGGLKGIVYEKSNFCFIRIRSFSVLHGSAKGIRLRRPDEPPETATNPRQRILFCVFEDEPILRARASLL